MRYVSKNSKYFIIVVKIPKNSYNIKVATSDVGTLLWYGDNKYDCHYFIDISSKRLNVVFWFLMNNKRKVVLLIKKETEAKL